MRFVNPDITYFPFSLWHYSLLPMLLVSILGIVYIDSYWWLLLSIVNWWFLTLVCQSVALHRYFTHRSFKLAPWKERILACLCIFAHTGAPANFAVSHAYHHSNADKPTDLHDPANIGILNSVIARYPLTVFDFKSRPDLQTPFYINLDRYSTRIVILFQLILLLINWKIAVFGLIIPQLLAIISLLVGIVVMGHSNFLSYRNFNTDDKSKNSPLVFLIFFGEAWHNNHHANPGRFSFKEKWWEFDPAEYIVKLIRDDK
ncbi:OLE1 Fatty-acid desaturase [uncultured Caudovirales phage]|uniref:OLE1 Fatty-acid desaturase n=1 Tax=uncultured Caudovirales phage TaxID=2100421 RepID=A0A6J7WED9_9CAUD|nr:OLE1 Fatty-acid desaturase [uncultured Caudovirales phage]CAB5208786.1 OLE1 Fatty-acid desaturase [uncultured Caudovirales phage]